MAHTLTTLLILFASFISGVVTEEVFFFQEPEYIIDEIIGGNNANTDIRITRSGDNEDTDLATQITLTDTCPAGVQATASSETDYSFTTSVSFQAGELFKDIQVTITNDDDDEFREFFCLTITTNPGNQYTTKVYIPGNDYCIHTHTPATSSADSIDPTFLTYVGPWYVGVTGIPDSFYFDVSPQSATDGGVGEQLNIFMRNTADQNVIGTYYGVLLDIVDPIDDALATADPQDSAVMLINGFSVSEVGVMNDYSSTSVDVVATAGSSFTLQYKETNGQFLLTDRADNRPFSADDSGTPVDVSHVFVSSGNSQQARWSVCGMLPRKLPAVSASASGYEVGYAPTKATDNDRNTNGLPNTGCFVSSSETDPWLQIDLGREFAVMMVLIWPVTIDGANADPSWIDDADVYVGSCPPTTGASLTSNNLCDNDIDNYAGQTVMEVTCGANANGRYVFVHLDTDTAQRFAVCEVEVYGDDIPIGEETTVEFSSATFETSDDESAETVTVSATRTGTAPTCTTVDFYTDANGIINGGTADFTPVLSTSPATLSWTAGATSTQTYTVEVNNDNECESTETFEVFLENADGGSLGQMSSATVSIDDNDSVNYALTSLSYSVSEGGTVDIGVSRSGVGTQQSGSAGLLFTDVTAQAEDYASTATSVVFTASSISPQSYTLSTVDDEIYEGDESFTVALDTLEPVTCSSVDTPYTATVTIKDNDSRFSFVTDDETLTISEGTSTTTLNIEREGLDQTKTIDIVVDEVSADDSTDFSVSERSVVFPINDATQAIRFYVEDDSLVEGDESFTVTLKDPNYTEGSGNLYETSRVTVVIKDNDAEYTWKQTQYETSEGSGPVQVCLLRTGDTTTTRTVDINTISGTATQGTDFTKLTQITFNGNTEACGNVYIEEDDKVETSETFTVNIADDQQDVEVGAIQTATITITDDDSIVSWQSTAYTFSESSRTNVVKITKTGTVSKTVTITSQQDSATQGVDYEGVSTTLTLSDTSNTLTITIYDDIIDEPSETFTLTLSGTGFPSQTTYITIDDDDLTPTTPPPSSDLGGGAIAGIVVAAAVALMAIIIGATCAFTVCKNASGMGAESGPNRPALMAHATAGIPPGFQGYPLGNYSQPLGLVNLGGNGIILNNGLGNGIGYVPNQQTLNQQVGLLANQQFGMLANQQVTGIPNQQIAGSPNQQIAGIPNQRIGGYNQNGFGIA